MLVQCLCALTKVLLMLVSQLQLGFFSCLMHRNSSAQVISSKLMVTLKACIVLGCMFGKAQWIGLAHNGVESQVHQVGSHRYLVHSSSKDVVQLNSPIC